MNRAKLERRVRAGLLVSTAVTVFACIANHAAAQADQQSPIEQVIITGSRIPIQGLASPSPLVVVNNEDFKVTGAINVENLLNNLPQVYAAQGSSISSGSTGTATVNLRNLGANRTLVLIDGKRLMPGDPNIASPNHGDVAAADINNIPAALIDHIEVLTGGASAVYGSDAVAGVVNFVMRKDFQGVEFDGTWNQALHQNNNALGRRIVFDAGFPEAPDSLFDGRNVDVTGIIGVNSPNGRGNFTGYLGFRNTRPITQSRRDFSACATAADFLGSFFCAGSTNAAVGYFAPQDAVNPNFDQAFRSNTNGTFTPFDNATDTYNYGPPNYLQRPDKRYSAGGFGHYEVSPMLDFYTSLMFMDDHTVAQVAPSGLFRGSGTDFGLYDVNCDNPFLTAQVTSLVCAGLGPTDNAALDIGRRTVEIGPRQDDLRHTDYRLVVGLRGQIAQNWTYELFGQYGTSVYAEEYRNDVSVSRVANALQVVSVNGTPTCKAALPGGSDPKCVPLDIFTLGNFTSAMGAYISTPGFKNGNTTEHIVGLNLTGDLGIIRSDWAMNPIALSVGAEYRREALDLRVDSEFSSGDLAGQGGPTPNESGAFNVKEVYGEIGVPLIEGRQFFQSLRFGAGARYSSYNLVGNTTSWKLDAAWAPTSDVTVRGSLQHAVRVPNVLELFQPTAITLWGGNDPCAGGAPALTAAQCALTGVTAAQYGHVDECPTAQCSALTGGNIALKPEDADTKTFGLVFSPRFFNGLTATVDYFDINVRGLISTAPQSDVLNNCATGTDPSECNLIHRTPGTGTIFGLFGYVTSLNLNTGFLSTDGIDVAVNYRLPLADVGLGSYGALAFNLQGTWLNTYKEQTALGHPVFDCAGLFGLVCTGSNASAPLPVWRHQLRLSWNTPWDVGITATWRHLSSVKFDGNTNDPVLNAPCGGPCNDLSDARIADFDYLDLAVHWTVRQGVHLWFGVNNVFDRDPPFLDTNNLGISAPPYGNANTYPQLYDSLGRMVFVNVTVTY